MSMNDSQLREELKSVGVNVGPINDTTRDTYVRILAKKKGGTSPSRARRSSPSRAKPTTSPTRPTPKPVPVSPTRPTSRPVPISPPRRASPSTRRQSPPATRRQPSPPARRESPPPTRTAPYAQHTSNWNPSPPASRPVPIVPQPRQSARPPISPTRPTPRPVPIPPTRRLSPPRVDFDNSVPDEDNYDDDDHMEFSKYIPRKPNYSYNRHQNTQNTSLSFLNDTKKKIAAVRPPKGFQLNPTFLAGVAFTICVFAYIACPDKIHNGINSGSDYVNTAVMTGFKYAVMPILVLGALLAFAYAVYYSIQVFSQKKAIYEEKKRKMIRDILKAVYQAPVNGIPVKQLRDRMIPAYKRTKDELYLWNECEDFVKAYETRVRAEERANHNGDEIVEHFIWVASTLNQDLEDD